MKNSKFIIKHNTDGQDMRDKCIGLDVDRESFPRDVAEYLHTNRGLHIQIRHNEDPQTSAQAIAVAKLIATAPELLEALELVLSDLQQLQRKGVDVNGVGMTAVARLIKKAKGDA